MVPSLLTQPPGRGRTDGRAGLIRGPHHDLALDANLCTEVQRRLRGQLKAKGSTWHMDETFVRIAGRWRYLFRAVDSGGQTVDFYLSETRDRETAKCLLKRALANPDNRPPHVFARDRLRSYPAAIRELQNKGQLGRGCRHRTRRYANNRIESDHRYVKRRLRAMQDPPDHSHCLRRDRRNRGSADDSQRPSTRDYQKEPARPSLGVRRSAWYQLTPCGNRYSIRASH
jgi:hypothetical protein